MRAQHRPAPARFHRRRSPSAMPRAAASCGCSSTVGSGRWPASRADFPVRVMVCHWSRTRPVLSRSGRSTVGACTGARGHGRDEPRTAVGMEEAAIGEEAILAARRTAPARRRPRRRSRHERRCRNRACRRSRRPRARRARGRCRRRSFQAKASPKPMRRATWRRSTNRAAPRRAPAGTAAGARCGARSW